MNKMVCLYSCFLLLPCLAFSQNDSIWVQSIFDRLLSAYGHINKEPELLVSHSTDYVAYMNGEGGGMIHIEEKAIEVCKSLGDRAEDAMAAILGHELIHFYKGHKTTLNTFESYFCPLHLPKGKSDLQLLRLEYEKDADKAGMMLALRAGFEPLGIMPTLLDAVYDVYGRWSNMPSYPSLEARKHIARQAQKDAQYLAYLFEMANYVSLVKEYELANALYHEVQLSFPSREVYNNLSVNSLLQALSLKPDLPYAFPIELDQKSRLSLRAPSMSPRERENLFYNLLEDARNSLEKAKRIDDKYVAAYTNLACVYVLQDKGVDAEFWARKAVAYASQQKVSKQEVDANIMLGIVFANQGDSLLAAQCLTQANFSANRRQKEIISHNRGILAAQGKLSLSSEAVDAPLSACLLAEPINDIDLYEFITDDSQRDADTLSVFPRDNSSVIFSYKKFPQSHILMCEYGSPSNRYILAFQAVLPAYNGTATKGVKNGDNYDKLIEACEKASRTLETPEGSYLIYEQVGIIFSLNQHNMITHWCKYEAE